MSNRVRVWVVGNDERTLKISRFLGDQGFATDITSADTRGMTEADIARWADVTLLIADGESLDAAQAVTLGLALGARRPVVFLSPSEVRFPVIASRSFTLTEPVQMSALAFQLDTLGRKRAKGRSSRAERNTAEEGPAENRGDNFGEPQEGFDSLLERRVFESLRRDPSISRLIRESPRATLTGTPSPVPDFLVWVEGAASFNPLPLEVTGGQDRRRVMTRLFTAMEASNARLAIVIAEGGGPRPTEFVEIEKGKAILWIDSGLLESPGWSLSNRVRVARNRLLHSAGDRGNV